jgi:hypothetical protein
MNPLVSSAVAKVTSLGEAADRGGLSFATIADADMYFTNQGLELVGRDTACERMSQQCADDERHSDSKRQ